MQGKERREKILEQYTAIVGALENDDSPRFAWSSTTETYRPINYVSPADRDRAREKYNRARLSVKRLLGALERSSSSSPKREEIAIQLAPLIAVLRTERDQRILSAPSMAVTPTVPIRFVSQPIKAVEFAFVGTPELEPPSRPLAEEVQQSPPPVSADLEFD